MKAFFINCELSFWRDAARIMVEDHGWNVAYWSGTKAIRDQISQSFPDAVFHLFHDAVKGIPPEEFAGDAYPALDQPLLEKLANCESVALKMMDRLGVVSSLNYQEQIRHYFRLVKYWRHVIEKLRPGVAVFPASPHVIYDYILYELCKLFSVKTVMFERTSIPGLVYPESRFEEGNPRLRSLYEAGLKNNGAVQLSATTEAHLEKIKSPYSEGAPAHVKFKNANLNESLGLLKKAYLLYTRGIPETYDKIPGRKIEDPEMTPLENLKKTRLGRLKRRELALCWDRLAETPDLDKPFVYAALHCQPERSTSPNGGVYAHQFLMVELLSQCVPQGWRVYVKEHPSQFKRFQRAERSKIPEFYEDMAALGNVTLVPLSMDSFELIDRAKAVATISGSVGFEAVVRGTPVLLFGHAWFRWCEGTFFTADRESLVQAISAIESGYKVSEQRLRKYLHAVERIGTRGYIDSVYEKVLDIPGKENAAAIAKALEHHLREDTVEERQ
ncbi:MAG: hypothetical protein SVS15_00095 [Thermodesulfobacteriota bacterium]|nr:hypothetical protein [Thermodesulfobacteriota bacterium]